MKIEINSKDPLHIFVDYEKVYTGCADMEELFEWLIEHYEEEGNGYEETLY